MSQLYSLAGMLRISRRSANLFRTGNVESVAHLHPTHWRILRALLLRSQEYHNYGHFIGLYPSVQWHVRSLVTCARILIAVLYIIPAWAFRPFAPGSRRGKRTRHVSQFLSRVDKSIPVQSPMTQYRRFSSVWKQLLAENSTCKDLSLLTLHRCDDRSSTVQAVKAEYAPWN